MAAVGGKGRTNRETRLASRPEISILTRDASRLSNVHASPCQKTIPARIVTSPHWSRRHWAFGSAALACGLNARANPWPGRLNNTPNTRRKGLSRRAGEGTSNDGRIMAEKTIPHVTLVDLDFDSLVGKSPEEVYRHFRRCDRVNRKKFFPRSVQWDTYRVTVSPERITIHLSQDGKEAASFSFLPAPRFPAR